MVIWQIWAILGLGFLILEMFMPAMFFLNFAIGAFVTALVALVVTSWTNLILLFSLISLVSLLLLRPILMKKTPKETDTGINAKYIGKIAKVVETVNSKSGVISIYDERWQARSEEEIPVGSEVEIISNNSLIMNVKEVK